MKLGAMSTAVLHLSLEDGLRRLRELGADAVEIGCGGFEPPHWANFDELLENRSKLDEWLETFQRHELGISAFAIHGEPLAPNDTVAREYEREYVRACRLAEACGVSRLTLLAGLPEGAPGDSAPCWVTSPFPPVNQDIYAWQWEERVLPYWREKAKIAEDHGCRLCFEMIECDVVYNPVTLVRLRDALGPVVCCNFDPSHLFPQGIDPLRAMMYLGDCIAHVHAKDTGLNVETVALNGLFDMTPHSNLQERAWNFRTVGFGHSESFWRDFVSTLRLIGYDDVISIEHEDGYMDREEGLEKAARLLNEIILRRPSGDAWFGYEGAQSSSWLARSTE